MGMEMASSIKEIETGRSHTKAVLFVAIQPAPRCTSDEAVLMIFPSKWGYQSRNEEKGFLFGVASIRCRAFGKRVSRQGCNSSYIEEYLRLPNLFPFSTLT